MDERIEVLERALRKAKLAGALGLSLLGVVALAGARGDAPGEVAASRFTLVGPDGIKRGEWSCGRPGQGEPYVQLALFGLDRAAGKEVQKLSLYVTSDPVPRPALILSGANFLDTSAILSQDEDGAAYLEFLRGFKSTLRIPAKAKRR